MSVSPASRYVDLVRPTPDVFLGDLTCQRSRVPVFRHSVLPGASVRSKNVIQAVTACRRSWPECGAAFGRRGGTYHRRFEGLMSPRYRRRTSAMTPRPRQDCTCGPYSRCSERGDNDKSRRSHGDDQHRRRKRCGGEHATSSAVGDDHASRSGRGDAFPGRRLRAADRAIGPSVSASTCDSTAVTSLVTSHRRRAC